VRKINPKIWLRLRIFSPCIVNIPGLGFKAEEEEEEEEYIYIYIYIYILYYI